MKYVLTAKEMKEADQRTSNVFHVSPAVLMERAAILTAGRVIRRLDLKYDSISEGSVLVVCGPGNNGGDGFACARILLEQGINVFISIPGGKDKLSGLPYEQYLSVKALNENCEIEDDFLLYRFDVIVDAIFGISLSREIEGKFKTAVDAINRAGKSGTAVISIDIPSGVDADTGQILGSAVKADETLVCGFLKPGNLLYPGAEYTGESIIGNIGITEKSLNSEPLLFCPETKDIFLPERTDYSNKGTFGKVLIVAGNEEIAGAAVLSALAALRTGCGMVRVLTSENNRAVLQASVPEAFVSCYNGTESGESEESLEALVKKTIEWCDVIAIGPGIGRSAFSERLLRSVMRNSGGRSLVLDADALNIISEHNDILSLCNSEMIITPHLREMSRLTGISTEDLKKDLLGAARDYASLYHLTVVLKDARTVTAFENGNAVINTKGNNGMATAGSGDVLTGMIAALLSQGVKPRAAACLGVSLHALAGDRAAEEKGKHALIAGDIINMIGKP